LAAPALAGYGLSAFTALVDVQPNVASYDERRRSLEMSQCAHCSLVDFLKARDLEPFPLLQKLRAFFAKLPHIDRALARDDGESLAKVCSDVGARKVFLMTGARRIDLPRIHAVKAGDSIVDIARARWALVSPDRGGVEGVLDGVARAARAGVTRILVGYHEHAHAVDGWTTFVEAAGPGAFDEIIRGAMALGAREVVALIAYPPCAMLQWPQHKPLEALRARLDIQLRRTDAESSMMCPENVSGYVLFNDSASARALAIRDTYGVRYEDLVILL
jgi:hypothetical protein